jgi:hypothetical protein
MSLQQGGDAVGSPIMRRNIGFFARYRRSPNISGISGGRQIVLFRAGSAAKYRAGGDPYRACILAGMMRPSVTAPAFLAHLLTRLHHPNLGRLDLTQSFKRQHFQALRLRSVLAGPTPPPI